MANKNPINAAQAHQHAYDVVEAARAAVDRSEQSEAERRLQRRRAQAPEPKVDPDDENTLRALLTDSCAQ